MKQKFITALLTICLAGSVAAQQLPIYSQLYFMRMLYNPALTAYNGSSNIYLFDREQWMAMPGHPTTRGGMGEISLWKDRSGVGISVYNDVTDIISSVNGQLYYAQKVKLGKDHLLSLGLSGGLMQTRIDYSNLVASDVTDPHLLSAVRGGLAFDMNVGLAYQWRKLTISLSVPHVANSNVNIASQLKNTQYDTKRHYVGGASYEFSFKNETWNLEPSVLVKKGSGDPIQVDANLMANYKRMFFRGAGYRLDYGISGMAAVRISHVVTLGYAYEYAMVSHVNYGSLGATHEIIVGLNMDKWLKNDELKKQAKRIDSLNAKMDRAQKRLDEDSAKLKAIDTLKNRVDQNDKDIKEIKEHQDTTDKIQKEIQRQVDSFENEVKEYRKQVDKKPVKDFSNVMQKGSKDPKAAAEATGTGKDKPANITATKEAAGTNGKTKVKWNNPDPLGAGDKPMMDNVAQGDILKMDQVNFEKNSSYLTTESYKQLDMLVQVLTENPGVHIKVMGHTDYIASDEYNQWLSDRRAKRVADYLISKGINAANVAHIGFGKRNPVADNATEEGRAKNRRVEIQVTKK